MLDLYGAAKKEKPQKKSLGEKVEPSPPNSSSQSSPSVTNSPPFKKKVKYRFFLFDSNISHSEVDERTGDEC
jgi:hypothetical protein